MEVEDGKALVVEGQASCEEGASSSTLTFRRIFSLPSQADVAAITSALSSDGVLTILTPKIKREVEVPTAWKSVAQSHSSHEEQSGVTEAWAGQQARQIQREVEVPTTSKSVAQSHSSREEQSAVAEAWAGQQVRQKVTESTRCYSEAYSKSGSSSSTTTSNSSNSGSSSSSSLRSGSCTQQQFSSHNVF